MENEIKGKYVVITSKFNCQSYPINEKSIFVSQKDLNQIGISKCFDLENNCVIEYNNTEELERQRKQELRAKREPLLIAFDKYKSNVNYGVEFESEEQRQLIIEWYNDIKDLDENAILNVPEKIKYYL